MPLETVAVAIILLVIAIFAIAILGFALWIWMLVDCAQRRFKNENEKIVWILIIVLTGILGAIIYYFVVKHSNKKGVSK